MAYLVGKNNTTASNFKTTFKASAGQTSKSFLVDLNPSLLSVYRNGVLLYPSDYSVSGKTITFNVALELDDEITVESIASVDVELSNAVKTADTIIGFDSTGYEDGDIIYFRGRETVGDGAGGKLRFIAGSVAASNGVTIYATNGGRLVREGFSVFGIDVKWAGAKTGIDSTSAIQAACLAGKYVKFGDSTDSYTVSGTIQIQSNTVLEMNGASITQTVDQAPIFDASNSNGVRIFGGVFNGKSETSYLNSPSSQAICIKANNVTDIKVTRNTFNNFWYSPLMVSTGGVDVEFSYNKVIGPGNSVLGVDVNRRNTTGVTVIGNGTKITFNEISGTSQGVIVGQGSQDVIVLGNFIHDLINEHGIYADTGLKRLLISNNVIKNTGAHGTGLKVQSYDEYGIQSEEITISDNIISDTGGDAILVDNTSSTPTLRTKGVSISGNNIRRAGAYGIDLRDVEDGYITDNIVIGALTSGIAWGNCININIIDNTVKDTSLSGIRDLSPSYDIILRGNTIKNCAQSTAESDKYGILINDVVSNMFIDSNFIDDENAKMQYGVFIVSNINQTLSLTKNTVLRSTDCGLRLINTGALRRYSENNWNGTLSATFNEPVLPVVMSDSTITLPQNSPIVSIGNTTNISSIVASGHSGRTVTLIFQGALQVIRGSNLVLNQSLGSFNTSANDTLTLVCDGNYWYEINRSQN